MNIKAIEKKAKDILNECGAYQLPIPIEDIVNQRGLKIKPFDFGDTASGALVIDAGDAVIGINPTESKVRQRFTIAHELGHYELHRQEKNLFVDKEFKVLFRDNKILKGDVIQEQEANAFAAAILMPEELVIKETKKRKFDFNDENTLKELAKLFNVSVPAMTIRISNLNLFFHY